MELLDLPDEVLINLLCSLDAVSIRRCLRTCKLLRSIVEGSVAIQYILALDLAGYIDGPSSSKISTVDRYQRLQHHQQAWRDVEWRQHNEYTIDRRSSTYELYGGVYAQGLERPDTELSPHSITRGMELIEFPSLLRNQPEGHTWTIPDLGVDTKDFGMDPDKNLLVLMERVPALRSRRDNPPLSVHLLNLRGENATPHSLAQQPVLSYQPRMFVSEYSYWVQVVGDLLAVLFRPGPIVEEAFDVVPAEYPAADEIVLWNWKTGDRITSIRFEGKAARSFSFLANDTLLVPTTIFNYWPVLRLYRLEGAPGFIEPVLIAQYGLPALTEDVSLCEVTCRLDPSPWAPQSRDPLHKDASSKCSTAHEGDSGGKNEEEEKDTAEPVWPEHGPPPFAPLPSSRIIVLSLGVQVAVRRTMAGQVFQGQAWKNYTVFVKADALLEFWKTVDPPDSMDSLHLHQKEDRDGHRHDTFVQVPWEAWGSKNTRFLVEGTETGCVCYVYGLRYCRLVLSPEDNVQMRVMDFNSVDFTKALEADAEAHATMTSISSGGTGDSLAPDPANSILRSPHGRHYLDPNSSSVDQAMSEPSPDDNADADQGQDQEFNEEDFLPHLLAMPGTYHLDGVEADDDDGTWLDVENDDDNDLDEDDEDAADLQDIWHPRQDSVAGFGVLRTGSAAMKEQFERTRIAMGPTYVTDRAVFTDERIQTELPFRWAFKDAPEVRRFAKVMIDNEHIIGLRPATAGSTGRLALDVLTL